MYLDFAVQHHSLVQELNIRDTLQIEEKLPHRLTDEQVDLLRGMKLKVLRSCKVKISAPVVKQEPTIEEQEDQQFRETKIASNVFEFGMKQMTFPMADFIKK